MSSRIQDAGKGAFVRMMLYAYPGNGKTSFIGSGAADGMKVLIVRSSLDQVPKRVLGSGTKEWVADTWEDMLEVQEYAQAHGSEWDWIWWDCLSIAQDVLLDDIWSAVIAEKPHRNNLTPSGGLDRGEYGRNMERIAGHVRHMVGARTFHYGITCHPFEGKHPTDDEAGTLLQPYIQGKSMVQKICGYMNTVAFMEVKENSEKGLKWRRMHFAENERFYAKDQQDGFLPKGYGDNLTLQQVTAALTGAAPHRGKSSTTTRRAPARRRREQ